MIIPVRDLLKIENIDSCNLMFNRKDPSISAIFIVSQTRDINKSYLVTKEHLNDLFQRNIINVSINTDRKFQEVLKKINPSLFIPLSGTIPINQLPQMVKEYEIMNQKSKKRRKITILEDVYSSEINRSSGNKELLIEYGTMLNSKIMSIVKNEVESVDQEIHYKDSEEGVLVFIPDVRNFKMKVDLFAILASLDLEIYDAKNVTDAIEFYKSKSPKLIVLGNLNGSLESKVVLLELEEYDHYIKKLNYDESPASNREFETQRIKASYYSGYAKFLELENRGKEMLPEEIKQNIMEALHKLQTDYSFGNYTETAFAVKQFGRMFNVTSLLHMLKNIKNKYAG